MNIHNVSVSFFLAVISMMSLSAFAVDDSIFNKMMANCQSSSGSRLNILNSYVKGDMWCTKYKCLNSNTSVGPTAEVCKGMNEVLKSSKDIGNIEKKSPTTETYASMSRLEHCDGEEAESGQFSKGDKTCIKYSCKSSGLVNSSVSCMDTVAYNKMKESMKNDGAELICQHTVIGGKRAVSCDDGESYGHMSGTNDSEYSEKASLNSKILIEPDFSDSSGSSPD
jgi:hypothetical protein